MSGRVSLLDTRLGLGLAGAAAVALGVAVAMWLQGAGPARMAAAPAPASAAWNGPIGPGALPAGPAAPAARDTEAPLTDTEGRLRLDARLHALFDAYLLTSGDESHAGALHAYLKARLAPPLLREADQLADAYRRYLEAEQALRRQERFTQADSAGLSEAQVTRMLAWQQTRARLRERMLGMAVAQAWFGADDADCRSAFEDWHTMLAPPGSDEVDSNELQARRLHGAVLEERRNARAQACAARLMGAGPMNTEQKR